jgi:mannose-6-phosphate isomerase-like protein (cupin superfamily)
MKMLLFLLVLIPLSASAEGPTVLETDHVPAVTVSPGVILKELTGRSAPGSARSKICSVAFFHLEPGRASAWSFNKVAEESFFILKGHGEVWTGNRGQKVEPGSFILVPPGMVRSVRAGKSEALEFYAVTSPAWSQSDDFMAQAPAGFTHP